MIATRHFPEVARPILQRLADQAGETAIIGVMSDDGTAIIYADMVESGNPIRFAAKIGDRRPLYCSAGGRLLLAYRPAGEIDGYFARTKLVAMTPQTVTNPKQLRAILQEIRSTGLARTVGQTAPDVSGIAVPIHASDGSVTAALLPAAPWSRAAPRADALTELTVAARDISGLLGYPGADGPPPAPQGTEVQTSRK